MMDTTPAPLCTNDLNEAIATTALAEVGVTVLTNPARVAEYLASVGLSPGFAWCASFAYWCCRQASRIAGVVNPCPRTGGVLRLWDLCDAACRTMVPVRGAIGILDHGQGLGHAFIVLEVHGQDATGAWLVNEVSGNTNDQGSRTGHMVMTHDGNPEVVHRGRLKGYIDLSKAAQSPAAA